MGRMIAPRPVTGKMEGENMELLVVVSDGDRLGVVWRSATEMGMTAEGTTARYINDDTL